jgi:hypothetical protein
MKVIRLTEEQKDLLVGKEYTKDITFNPILDGLNNWIITTIDKDNLTNNEFDWIKDLEEVEFIL